MIIDDNIKKRAILLNGVEPIDTGASVTLMSEEFQENRKEWSYPSGIQSQAVSYTDNNIKVVGCADVTII